MADLIEFPTLEEVRKRIESFNQSDWPEFELADNVQEYVEKVSKLFTKEFNVLPDIIQFEPIDKLGFRFFRVREVSTFKNIDLTCEHSYRPINLTNTLNRCNFPRHPVFYCSNNAMTALAEIASDNEYVNKKYCISLWGLHPTTDKVLIQPYLFSDLDKDNIFNIWKNGLANKINEPFENKLSSDQEEGLKLYLKFMSDIFINDGNYKKSAFFAHRRLYAPRNYKTEILVYPSVQTGFKGANMAIHPNFVDKQMYPKRFYIVQIESINREKGSINLKFTGFGELERSSIMWRHLTKDKNDDYKRCVKEDFDYDGNFEFEENAP